MKLFLANQNKQLSRNKKVLLALVILPVAMLVIYLGAVRPIRIAMERAQFNQAEKDLEATYSQIVAAVGEPNEVKRNKSCGYGSALYERGPRSCGISISAVYTKPGLENANNIVSNISTVVGDQAEGFVYETGKTTKFIDHSQSQIQHLSSNIRNIEQRSISCRSDYYYKKINGVDNTESNTSPSLSIIIMCSKSALAEYYPVHND